MRRLKQAREIITRLDAKRADFFPSRLFYPAHPRAGPGISSDCARPPLEQWPRPEGDPKPEREPACGNARVIPGSTRAGFAIGCSRLIDYCLGAQLWFASGWTWRRGQHRRGSGPGSAGALGAANHARRCFGHNQRQPSIVGAATHARQRYGRGDRQPKVVAAGATHAR
jgi:hypothetical protein